MIELIRTKDDYCTGCNRCVRECPMETANITFQDSNGNIKVRIDDEKCIVCGLCISACKHDARYYVDDTERFFEDLAKGVPISIMAAPAIRTNIPEYKRVYTYLKSLGVNKIYDVSLGADISIWGHVRYLEKHREPMITQPCPVIVMYLEIYRHDLLKKLSPVHGPMGSASVYMRKYQGISDNIAALSPCIAKSIEFRDTGIAQYNITFPKLLNYLEDNYVILPIEETEYDHEESGLGTIFPVPGGLKENIEYFLGQNPYILRAEGFNVFEKLNEYAETPDEFLPDVFDVLSCVEGCNLGPACSHSQGLFEIDKVMDNRRKHATLDRDRKYYEDVYKKFDERFELSDFLREYNTISTHTPEITDADINKAYELLGKNDYEKQNVDCGACGSETCHDMARKIALGVNIPINCIVKAMEDAKTEHEHYVLANEQLEKAEVDIAETKNILLDTERQRIEAEAANKAKSSFLSTMSHEIRTPMNAILGITEIQLFNESLDPHVKEAFNKIYSSGDLLLSLINDILDLSKIEAGKLELVLAKYEIASLISDTVQLNIMRAGNKPIDFKLFVDENLPAFMMGDALRIKQVLNNLLSNAFKYTLQGEVNLSVTFEPIDGNDEDVTFIFTVGDTGQGMTEDQVKKLFDEYAQFNIETNRATEGTGLGMSITQNLISLMDGEISVKSEPDKGSEFTVRLPQGKVGTEILGLEVTENLQHFRSDSMAQMKRVNITRDPMPYGVILIVDDVDTNIYVAKGLMAPYELQIDSAGSGYVAIEKIKSGNEYDIIFMDHMMPDMDGVETTKIIRELGYKNPIVALTANAVQGQADVFFDNGFDDFISKPIDVRHLNTILNTHIRDKQPPEIVEAFRKIAATRKKKDHDDTAAPEIDPVFAEIFVRDATKALAILEEISRAGDYENKDIMRSYIINVHGMKSALANIGNTDLASIAGDLEKAGRDGSLETIKAETPGFLAGLRAFTNELIPEEDPDAENNTDEDKDYLAEKLLAIKAACEEYDEQAADEALADLREKTWSRETKEILDGIAEKLLHSDFDEIVDLIDKDRE